MHDDVMRSLDRRWRAPAPARRRVLRAATSVFLLACAAAAALPGQAAGEEVPPTPDWRYRAEFLRELVLQVPVLLKGQDPATGRFGSGIWIVTDQNALLPLAAAWSLKDPANPYYRDPKVLDAVMKGGDALIADQDKAGKWVFRKKDGSTWGDIYMPWTYSRWVRAFGLIREAMPADRRARWEKALTLGFEGIARDELKTIHNIPAHHAMGLYCAGEALDRPEWKRQAAAFLRRVAEHQDPGGFWSENFGPVVGYNFVYTDALGVYYALSKDRAVLPALERAARFHAAFTYPDGSSVETVDERQTYHDTVAMPNVGFSFTPEGRGYVRSQWERLAARRKPGENKPILSGDMAASYLLYGEEGTAAPPPADREKGRFVLGKSDALVERSRPWFVALSAYHAPVPNSRWIQDRQNLVSLFHDRVGLIVGGGNTKLQPLWSTFTVGDMSLLAHRPGDESPDFTPPAGIYHVPTRAALGGESAAPALALTYGPAAACRVEVRPGSAGDTATLAYACDLATVGGLPVTAHVPLIPHVGGAWKTAAGKSGKLGAQPVRLTAEEAGGWFEHAGWRITLPPGATLRWPVLPHDPYTKDGRAKITQGRIVLSLPLSAESPRREVTVTVLPTGPL